MIAGVLGLGVKVISLSGCWLHKCLHVSSVRALLQLLLLHCYQFSLNSNLLQCQALCQELIFSFILAMTVSILFKEIEYSDLSTAFDAVLLQDK